MTKAEACYRVPGQEVKATRCKDCLASKSWRGSVRICTKLSPGQDVVHPEGTCNFAQTLAYE